MMYDPMENMNERRFGHGPFTADFSNAPVRMPRGAFRYGDDGFAHHGGEARCMPRGHGGHDISGEYSLDPGVFNGHDDALQCMPRGQGGPAGPGSHGFGPGGMPPRRPDPEFLKRRIDESDLLELIDMAGRMAQRRPQGGQARSQSLVLSILAGRESLSQRELQQMLGIQPGSLSELVSKLEGKGYLIREKAEDRRGNLLRITDEGRKAIPTADDLPEDDPFAALTDEQQDQLAALLRTLLSHWVDALEAADPRDRRVRFPRHNRPVEL